MKKILTNNIVEDVRRQPFNKASLEHIQEAFLEVFAGFIKNFTENTTNYFKLHGLVDSDGSGTGYNISAGAVYYNGEVYQVDTFVGSHATNVPVLNLGITYRAGDPVKFSDNNDFNVHEIKKLVISLAASGSGLVNLSALQKLGQNWVNDQRISDGSVVYSKIGFPVAYAEPVYAINSPDCDSLNNGLTMIPNSATNAPAAEYCMIIQTGHSIAFPTTSGNRQQLAIQISGAGAGAIFKRERYGFGDPWSAWTSINT